jgi:glycosyltransferase involved in cell wall biosynthesis
MKIFYVVADYREQPSEGMQVVSKALVDGLRSAGDRVEVLAPDRPWRWLPRLFAARRGVVVFTHGPGNGVVLLSAVIRRLTRMRIVWVATRPDLSQLPKALRGRRTAHAIVGNRKRSDLDSAAADHAFIQQFIGIDPTRLDSSTADTAPWPELVDGSKPVLLHVGHLRPNRGLDLLVEVKNLVGDAVDVVVQGSPTFEADPFVLKQLEEVGIVVRREFVRALADLYRACDLYVFPARPEAEGAIELPLGVLEAVACGRPVLTNDFGAVRAALADVPGVHITSPDSFATRVRELISEPDALSIRPHSLPDHLHARGVISAVHTASQDVECA